MSGLQHLNVFFVLVIRLQQCVVNFVVVLDMQKQVVGLVVVFNLQQRSVSLVFKLGLQQRVVNFVVMLGLLHYVVGFVINFCPHQFIFCNSVVLGLHHKILNLISFLSLQLIVTIYINYKICSSASLV